MQIIVKIMQINCNIRYPAQELALATARIVPWMAREEKTPSAIDGIIECQTSCWLLGNAKKYMYKIYASREISCQKTDNVLVESGYSGYMRKINLRKPVRF